MSGDTHGCHRSGGRHWHPLGIEASGTAKCSKTQSTVLQWRIFQLCDKSWAHRFANRSQGYRMSSRIITWLAWGKYTSFHGKSLWMLVDLPRASVSEWPWCLLYQTLGKSLFSLEPEWGWVDFWLWPPSGICVYFECVLQRFVHVAIPPRTVRGECGPSVADGDRIGALRDEV